MYWYWFTFCQVGHLHWISADQWLPRTNVKKHSAHEVLLNWFCLIESWKWNTTYRDELLNQIFCQTSRQYGENKIKTTILGDTRHFWVTSKFRKRSLVLINRSLHRPIQASISGWFDWHLKMRVIGNNLNLNYQTVNDILISWPDPNKAYCPQLNSLKQFLR